MSPFKIQHSNDVHRFLDDISDCWFVFSFTSLAESIASQFFFCWLYDLDWIDANGVPKTFAFFHIWRLQIGVHHTFLLNGVHHTFFCWNFLSSIYWQMPSIHRNETILIRNINPSKWDHFNLKLFKFLGELTECKLRCSIQFKTFFIRNEIILLGFSLIFFFKAKVPFFNCDST